MRTRDAWIPQLSYRSSGGLSAAPHGRLCYDFKPWPAPALDQTLSAVSTGNGSYEDTDRKREHHDDRSTSGAGIIGILPLPEQPNEHRHANPRRATDGCASDGI